MKKIKLILTLLTFTLMFFFIDFPIFNLTLSNKKPLLNFYGIMGYSPSGESMLSLVFWGCWQTLLIAILARIFAITFTMIGTFLSFQHDIFKKIITILSEAFITLPSILIAVALGFSLGSGNLAIVLAIGTSEWAMNQKWHLSRLTEYQSFDFIRYSKLLNASHFFIFKNHLTPYLKRDTVMLFFLYMPGSILTVAALEFLGLSSYSGVNGLGFQIAAYKDFIFVTPHVIVFPLLVLVGIVFLLSLLKQKVEKIIDREMI